MVEYSKLFYEFLNNDRRAILFTLGDVSKSLKIPVVKNLGTYEANLKSISRLTNLSSLQIPKVPESHRPPKELIDSCLMRLTNLRCLDIDYCLHFSYEALSPLTRLEVLKLNTLSKSLHDQDYHIEVVKLRYITRLLNLTSLSIPSICISELKRLNNLSHLAISEGK